MTKKNCCAVPQCRNSSEKTAGSDVIYQKCPTKEKIRRRWIKAIQSTFKTFSIDSSASFRLCSDHFDESSFISSKGGKRIFKLDAVPTIFISNIVKKEKNAEPSPTQEVEARSRHHSRRAASKEALKQMQILLEDEDDAVEVPDDDDEVVPVPVVVPPKKKYKLTHRKSSDGNDREVLVLKTIPPSITPSITNHYVENNLELECWVEELEPCQKERNKKLEEEAAALQSKLDELIKACKGEVVYKGDLTTIIEVSEHVQKTIQAVQASNNKPPIVLKTPIPTAQPGYQLVMDPRLGLIVGQVPATVASTPTKQGKIQVATNLQASISTSTSNQSTPVRPRPTRGKKQTPVVQATPPPVQPTPSPIATRSAMSVKQTNKRSQPQPPVAAAPATRSRVTDPPTPTQLVISSSVTRSREATVSSTQLSGSPVTRSRQPAAVVTHVRPTENSVEGGLTTGSNVKAKTIDLTTDDGRPLPDSREVSFNKLQGKTFPSLVVVARPHLRVADVNSDRAKLDVKVKAVLMYAPTKFTEWLIQQGLVKSEQKCSIHSTTQLKLGMYSDVSKFPYSGGYVWISECCPQRFVSVFSGSIFEGSPHPPLVILKILYHWSCQTNIQNVTQWVKVDNVYVKGMYTWLRAICSVGIQTHIRQLGGPQTKVEVGVISLGTTSQDGNSRQVKVEVLGILETTTKLIRLRAIEPLADGDRNYKKRFSKILEPLGQWVHPSSIIVTDLTVDKATLYQMGFTTVIQTTSVDANNSNRTIMEYLRRIVPRMFQNTLSLLSRQIIQQFLDELVWREWFGTTSMQAFDHLISHLAEQTRHDSNQSLIVKLNRVASNPFKNWGIPPTSKTAVPPAVPQISQADASKKRKRKEPEPPPPKQSLSKPAATKATPTTAQELTRPPKSTSPDVPEHMVPLENYYYGTIDNYPPKTNVTLNLKCPFCKEMFNNNIVLMSHLFKHAHNVSKDGEMCRYCLTSVPTANDLLKHIATAHPSETKHDNGFVCLICETQYMNPFVLGKHMSKEHCPSELPYQCGTCAYKCSNHKQAIDHFYKQHDNGPTIQCPFCLKSTTVFSSSRNIAQNMHYFIQHLQKHQKKQFARRCGKCNLWFIQKEVLKEHQTKMHASQRGKTGLVPWQAPRNGVMVPKSKTDKHPCDGDGINFTTLFYNVSKDLKCKECDGPMESSKHFPSFENCQNPNCQYSTCCSNAMQEHNAKCNKNSKPVIPKENLPCEMFCICGYSSEDGNDLAKHLATCEKKSAYPSLSDAKSASVTHSMLDVLGLVRKPEESDKKPSRTVKKTRSTPKVEAETINLIEEEAPVIKPEKSEEKKRSKKSSQDVAVAKEEEPTRPQKRKGSSIDSESKKNKPDKSEGNLESNETELKRKTRAKINVNISNVDDAETGTYKADDEDVEMVEGDKSAPSDANPEDQLPLKTTNDDKETSEIIENRSHGELQVLNSENVAEDSNIKDGEQSGNTEEEIKTEADEEIDDVLQEAESANKTFEDVETTDSAKVENISEDGENDGEPSLGELEPPKAQYVSVLDKQDTESADLGDTEPENPLETEAEKQERESRDLGDAESENPIETEFEQHDRESVNLGDVEPENPIETDLEKQERESRELGDVEPENPIETEFEKQDRETEDLGDTKPINPIETELEKQDREVEELGDMQPENPIETELEMEDRESEDLRDAQAENPIETDLEKEDKEFEGLGDDEHENPIETELEKQGIESDVLGDTEPANPIEIDPEDIDEDVDPAAENPSMSIDEEQHDDLDNIESKNPLDLEKQDDDNSESHKSLEQRESSENKEIDNETKADEIESIVENNTAEIEMQEESDDAVEEKADVPENGENTANTSNIPQVVEAPEENQLQTEHLDQTSTISDVINNMNTKDDYNVLGSDKAKPQHEILENESVCEKSGIDEPVCSNEDIEPKNIVDATPLLADLVENRHETGDNSNPQDGSEPMDHEDISDSMTAMETE